jgi:hypothetical protein
MRWPVPKNDPPFSGTGPRACDAPTESDRSQSGDALEDLIDERVSNCEGEAENACRVSTVGNFTMVFALLKLGAKA